MVLKPLFQAVRACMQQGFIAPGFGSAGGVDIGDAIANSLMLDSASGQYLSRTLGAPTDGRKWTYSIWIKRDFNGSYPMIMCAGAASQLYFDSAGNQDSLGWVGSGSGAFVTSRKFRDPSAYCHIVVSLDTTDATAGDRLKLYVNGVRETSFVSFTNPTLNDVSQLNSAAAHYIGRYASPGNYYGGMVAAIHFVDGQALTPSSFGRASADTGQWVSKTYAGTYGNNGFQLLFANSASLGSDSSGNGNNWTLNGSIVAANQMADTPTNNFCVLQPLLTNSGVETLAAGNLRVNYQSNAAGGGAVGTFAMAPGTGKWYWEISPKAIGSTQVGICPTSSARHFLSGANADLTNAYSTMNAYGYHNNGQKCSAAGRFIAYGASYTTTDVVGVLFDSDAMTIEFFKNGASQGVAYTGIVADEYYPAHADYNSGNYALLNFGQRRGDSANTYNAAAGGWFKYTPPTGAKSLCTSNLATPAILKPSTGIAVRSEAGSGIAANIAADRASWATWIEIFKRADSAENFKVRFSDDSGNMMALNTTGAKAAWSAPSAGTYSGYAIRAEAAYGVVTGTYVGDNTANKNITHSLGLAPKAALIKSEATGDWYFWHANFSGATYFQKANSPGAESATNTPFGTGNWSSTQFMVTNNATNNLNAAATTYRYILFTDVPGFLKCGTFTGNGSTDGFFVNYGHRPAFSLMAYTPGGVAMDILDAARNTYNPVTNNAALNSSGTLPSDAATVADFLSNGEKIRCTNAANRGYGNKYTFISFAETPFKYANAR